MGVIVPSGFVNIVFVGSMAGIDGEWLTALGATIDGSTPSGVLADQVYDAFISDGCWSQQSSTVSFDRVELRVGPSHPGGPVYLSSHGPTNGGESGDQLIPSTTCLLKKVTGLGGRKQRGRMYFPLLRDSHVDPDGKLNTTAAGTLQTAISNFYDDLVGLGLPPALFHSHLADAPTEITSLDLEGTVATQRGRLAR